MVCPKCKKGTICQQTEYNSAGKEVVKVCLICGWRDYNPVQEEVEMPTKGTNYKYDNCKDCGEHMRIISRGLCHKCRTAHKDAGTLDDLFPKSVAKGRPPKSTQAEKKPRCPGSSDVDGVNKAEPARVVPISKESEKQPQVEVRTSGLFIPRAERDKELFDALERVAIKERRTMDAQIMAMVEDTLREVGEL